MVADLNLPIKIMGGETLRESDGLAMSSRNRYLSEGERQLAPFIYQGLSAAKAAFAAGERSPEVLIVSCRNVIEQHQDFVVDYIELRQRRDLLPCGTSVAEASVMLVAVRLGTTRLIDNMEMD
jgi:pantoate--beta-alanine ligase